MSRKLTRCEVAAMWFYCAEYARSGLSSVDFWEQLSAPGKRLIRSMVKEIMEARDDRT